MPNLENRDKIKKSWKVLQKKEIKPPKDHKKGKEERKDSTNDGLNNSLVET